jgi:hypothetical protein
MYSNSANARQKSLWISHYIKKERHQLQNNIFDRIVTTVVTTWSFGNDVVILR